MHSVQICSWVSEYWHRFLLYPAVQAYELAIVYPTSHVRFRVKVDSGGERARRSLREEAVEKQKTPWLVARPYIYGND